MDPATETLLEVIAEAIRAEVDGNSFYMMAAKTTEDPKGREVFERLANDEVAHAQFLQAQYDSIQATGKIDPAVELPAPPSFDAEHPIFSPAIKQRIKQAHYEMSALSIGAQLELSAVNFYQAQAKAATDPAVASLFTRLAEWESRHYHALLAQQESLKQDYWTDNQFSPF